MKNLYSKNLILLISFYVFFGMKNVNACDANYRHTNAPAGDTTWFYANDQLAVYTWDFGDTSSGNENITHRVNAWHIYNTPGIYYVTLFVNIGAEWDYQTQIISVGTITFQSHFKSTCAGGHATQFSNNSIGHVISQQWNFGDAASGPADTTSLPNPYHQFTSAGNYTVTLIVSNGAISDTATKNILATDSCILGSVYLGIMDNNAGDTIFPTVNFLNYVQSYNWNYGDPASGAANISSGAAPWHIYSTQGTYVITLIKSNTAYTDTTFFPVCIIDKNVWPGDVNRDGIVNAEDILPIGIFYHTTGTPRSGATTNFTPQPATDWGGFGTQMYLQRMVDPKFEDCNGDGVANLNDINVIDANYGMQHTSQNRTSQMQYVQATDATLSVVLPATSSGSLSIPVYMSSCTNADSLIYGLSVSVKYDLSVGIGMWIQSIDFSNCFIGADTNVITYYHENASTQSVDVTIVRKDKIAIHGAGELFTIHMMNTAGNGNLHIYILPTAKIMKNGMFSSMNNQEIFKNVNLIGANTLYQSAGGINNLNDNISFEIYPNPANDFISIKGNFPANSTAEIFNSLGQKVKSVEKISSNGIQISELPNGIYMIEVKGKNYFATKTFVK